MKRVHPNREKEMKGAKHVLGCLRWGSLLLAAACGGDSGTTPPPGSATVNLYSSGGPRFVPAALTVAPGTVVSFVWQDGFHDIIATGVPTFTGVPVGVDPPKTHQFTFGAAATYAYYCSIHGQPTSGMRGTVNVP